MALIARCAVRLVTDHKCDIDNSMHRYTACNTLFCVCFLFCVCLFGGLPIMICAPHRHLEMLCASRQLVMLPWACGMLASVGSCGTAQQAWHQPNDWSCV